MLWTVAVVLALMWLLGLLIFQTGAAVHLLLAAAAIAVLMRFLERRSVV